MPSEQKVNILLVDDRAENLIALEAILDDLGENLLKAQSGEEALKRLLTQDVAVILLDVQMPGMDGFETATLIRQRDKTQHTPIIFVTAVGKSDTHVSRGYSLGAVDYIFKPIVSEILLAKVAVFVDLFRATVRVERQSKELADFNSQLRSSSAFLEAVLDSTIDGILTVDEHGIICSANRRAIEMFNYDESELVGKSLELTSPATERGTLC